MKNIIFIILALVIGVAETLGQTYLPNASATLVSGTIYTATTKTINGTLTVPTGGTVTIYIPAGVTLTINGANAGNGYNGNIGDESPRKSHSHNSTCAGNGGKENACGGAGGNGAMPAICVPTGATLILTGEGTLIATGGNAGSGGNGGNGQDAHGSFVINYYGGAGGAGAGGGGGAAAAIGGAGGHGGAGGYGGEYGANGFFGIIGPGSGGDGGNVGISGTSGQAMGNVWIIGNVTVETTNGNGSTEAAQISNGTQGTSGAEVSGWIPSFSGNMQFFGGNGGNFGYGGSAATYGIGGGGNGGDGGYGGHGGDIFRENQGTENESNEDQSYTPGSAGNGTLYVQQYTSINEPDITRTTHGTVNPITTDAQMPSAIATTFTIDGESTPLRSIFYGTVIEDMDLTTAEKTRTGYTFNGYKTKGTSTQVYDASGTFVYPITTIASSTNSSLNVSLNAPDNITLEADWIPNTYTVTLDNQSGTGGTGSVTATYDSAMPSATAPTRTGYTFGGYYSEANGGGTKYYNADMTSAHNWDIAHDQTLYALWIVPTFTITLNADGGSNGTTSVTVTFGNDMPSATAPTKTNYTFMGYFTDHNGRGTQYYYPDMSSKRVWDDDTGLINTLYAYWADCHTDKTIKVNYNSNGGYGTMEPQLVRLADDIRDNRFTKRDETTHKQNQFLEWNTKADGTGRGYQPGDVIFATEEYSEITLYAQWDPTFNDIYVIATADDLLDFATRVNGSSTPINGILATDIDMSGKTWTPIGTYSVPFQGIFDGNGYIVSNLTMADNDDYDQAGLIGYAKNATIKNVIVKNVTLYAKYSMAAACGRIDADASSTTAFLTRCGSYGTFNYTFRPTTPSYNAIGGLAIADKTYFMKNDPDPIRNTYISHVWSTFPKPYYVLESCTANNRIEGTVNYRSSQASCENGGLCYTMNDKTNGSTSWTQTIGVDECPRPTNRGRAVYKEGEDGIDYVPGDILYNIYNVYFISNGGTSTACGDTQVKRYSDGTNNGLSLPTTTREGYTFQGWYTEMEGGIPVSEALSSINADLILYAHWTVKKCTVILDADPVVPTPGTASINNVTYDQPMPTPEGLTAPTRTGYTFGGYYTGHNGSGTQYYTESMTSATDWLENTESETTLYAKWTANQYTVSFNARGGSPTPGDITVTYDAEYGTLSTPTRYGFTFDGWYTGETSGSQVTSSTTVHITDDQTLYARWNPITTDYDSYSVIGDPRLRGNYFRSFYDSHVAYELPDGVTAYKGQADGQYLVLTKIEVTDNNKNILPKDVPVILVAEPSYIDAKTEKGPEPTTGVSIKEISLTTSEYDVAYDGITGNMLIGTDVDIPVPNDSYLYYILSYGTVTKRLGFYKWPEGNTLSAHKAYVQQSPSSPAKALIFRFENEATGINDDAILDFADDASEPVIYNLNGIRLSKPQKGVNIINGKKVWVK